MKYLKFLVFFLKYVFRFIFDLLISYYVYYRSKKSEIFDPLFYKEKNNIKFKNHFLIFLHYYFKGYLSLKSPSRKFSTIYYYSLISDAYLFKINPLSDFF